MSAGGQTETVWSGVLSWNVNYPRAMRPQPTQSCLPISSCGWDGWAAGWTDRSLIQGDGKVSNEHQPTAFCVFDFSLSPSVMNPGQQRGLAGTWGLGETWGL